MDQTDHFEHVQTPDLGSPEMRRCLSPSAIKVFFAIADKWALTDEEASLLLGATDLDEMLHLKNFIGNRSLDKDTLMRISYTIGIFTALNILFSDKLANRWVILENRNSIFGGRSPLRYMIEGGLEAMRSVRRLLDAERFGN